MNNNYRLQLRHGNEDKIFSTRDDVISYINGQLQYGGVELLPYEPILFFYGADDAKNTIIMVGLPEGKTQDGKTYFLVDTANLQEQINESDSGVDEISEKLDNEIATRKEVDEKLQSSVDSLVEKTDKTNEGLTEEITNRESGDKKLQSIIDTNVNNLNNSINTINGSIATEIQERKAKDEEIEEAVNFSADNIQSLIDACGLIYNEKLADGRVSYEPDLHDEVIRDAKSVSEAIDKVSKFASTLGQSLKFSVEDTDTVDLTIEEDPKNGGGVIKAEVNIAGADGLSIKNFDNNIIGKTTDGLYASASIEPSTKNPNILIFKTSGYVDGKFKVDAYETEVPLAAYKGDNGKNTGVTVDVDADKNLIIATLNLASDETNLLKLEDGEYMVEGLAKNIKYKDTTVAQALTSHTSRLDDIEDTIEGVKAIDIKGSETSTSTVSVEKSAKGDFTIVNNVKLSPDNSIIIANGGLGANVNAVFKKGTSTLVINVGQTSYDIDLSDLAVSALKQAEYDSVTEEIVLIFIVGDGEKTMRIPVGTLIHDVEVDDTDTIDLTLKSVSGGPNRISGEVRVDKSHSDNILTVSSNGLYVSQAYITNAIKEESEDRSEADKELKQQIEEVSQIANANKTDITAEQNRAEKAEKANADAIAQEIKDARAAEQVNADKIVVNTAAIDANTKAIAQETLRATSVEQKNTSAIEAEILRAKTAEEGIQTNANDIASINTTINGVGGINEKLTSEITRATEKDNSLQKAIDAEISRAQTEENTIKGDVSSISTAIDNIVLKKDADLQYTLYVNDIQRGTLTIPKDQFLKSVDYNADTKKLEFVFVTSAGESNLSVSVADLVDTYINGDGLLLNGNSFSVDFDKVAKVEDLSKEIARAKEEEGNKANKSDVYTQEQINNKLDLYAKNSDVYTKAEIEQTYAKSSSVYTKSETDLMLESYAKKDNVYTKDEVNTTLGDYAKANEVYTKSEIDTTLGGYAKSVDVYTKNDITTKLQDYAKTIDVNTKLDAKLNVTDAENVYATKEALQKVKDDAVTNDALKNALSPINESISKNTSEIGNFGLTYNSATSELKYTDKNGSETTYKLYGGSLVKSGEFDTKSNSIVLTIENLGIESKITIPVSELLSDVTAKIDTNANNITTINEALAKLAKDWNVQSSGTVDLVKTTAGEKDLLTAKVKIASSNKQAIQSIDSGLYVSNDLEDFTVVYGSAGTVSGQTAISTLLDGVTTVKNDITKAFEDIADLEKTVETNTANITKLNSDFEKTKSDVAEVKQQVATNTASISTLDSKVDTAVSKVNAYENRIGTLENNMANTINRLTTVETNMQNVLNTITTYNEKIEKVQNSLTTLENTVNNITKEGGELSTILAEIDKIKTATGYENYTATKDMSTRIDALETEGGAAIKAEIENIEKNLIGSKDSPTEGSVWAELNNIVDAGEFN